LFIFWYSASSARIDDINNSIDLSKICCPNFSYSLGPTQIVNCYFVFEDVYFCSAKSDSLVDSAEILLKMGFFKAIKTIYDTPILDIPLFNALKIWLATEWSNGLCVTFYLSYITYKRRLVPKVVYVYLYVWLNI